jgi:hypothetical protein
MSDLVYCIATRGWEGWTDCVHTWLRTANDHHAIYVVSDRDVMPSFQDAYESTKAPVLAYIHDDLEIYEKGWDHRVLRQFLDGSVGLVGIAGALGHCSPSLYTTEYRIPNLARQSFLSNLRDAERHGARFVGETDVAVVDGMALFVRRDILDRWGGWPVDKPYGYWLYSEALCCETRRQGYRIRLVGIDALHLGGKSSGHIAASPTYEEAHRYLYENNRDMLPYRVPE